MEKKYKKAYIFLRNFALLIIITHCNPSPFYTRLYEDARNTSLNTVNRVDNIENEEIANTEQNETPIQDIPIETTTPPVDKIDQCDIDSDLDGICDENEIELCIPNTEICNGKDDDCDTIIDNNISDEIRNCGTGQCVGGIQIRSCILNGIGEWTDWSVCSTDINKTSEVCDNIDNDCDENVDNNILDIISGTNEGACRVEIQSCVNGSYQITQNGINPTNELCNGIDDNCDGTIDEELTRTTTCGVGICEGNIGIESCSNGTWSNNTCDPFEGEQTEICGDTLDSNCDGDIDDGCVVENKIDTFYQTSSYTITYTQEDTGQKSVDILWVVDNSISMEDNQQNLVDNFSNFITSIRESVPGSYVDYHIGVITTTEFTEPLSNKEIDQYNSNCIETGNCEGWSIEGHGRLQGINQSPKFITPDNVLSDFSTERCLAANISSGAECAFYENGMVGTGGHFAESGFITTELALTHPENLSNYNLGFSRDGVPIVIIFLSDSDDMSHWVIGTDPNNPLNTHWSETQRQCIEPYNYEFCVDTNNDDIKDYFDVNNMRSIEYFTNLFKNLKEDANSVKLFSIVITPDSVCELDSYPPSLDSDGNTYSYAYRYITLMEKFYNLTSTDPNPYVKDICNPGGFPQIISEIGSYISQNLKAQFALCNTNCDDINIDQNTIKVMVNGEPNTHWTYYSDSKMIVFDENFIPQDNDEVTISYDEIRITTFTLSTQNIKEIISVKINSQPIDNWSFNKALNQITIYDDSIKTADAIIEITYAYYAYFY